MSSMAHARIGFRGIHHLGERKAWSSLKSLGDVSGLSSYHTWRMLHGETIETATNGPHLYTDWVPTLVCSQSAALNEGLLVTQAQCYVSAAQNPPTTRNLTGVLTCLGKFASEKSHFEFRCSWGTHEILSVADITAWIKQACCAFKFAVQTRKQKASVYLKIIS